MSGKGWKEKERAERERERETYSVEEQANVAARQFLSQKRGQKQEVVIVDPNRVIFVFDYLGDGLGKLEREREREREREKRREREKEREGGDTHTHRSSATSKGG